MTTMVNGRPYHPAPAETVRDWDETAPFLPRIKSIVAQHVIQTADLAEDIGCDTDLVVKPTRVSCRVRRADTPREYWEEFTVRSWRPNDVKTELSKIVEGWGDLFFYGIAGEGTALASWFLGDLKVFRLWFTRQIVSLKGALPGIEKSNGDGTKFRVFRNADLPPEWVVARK